MGLLKRLLGREPASTPEQDTIERYRYLLRTAPPDAIEQAHAEAFASMTPEQRQQVQAELSAVTPEHERPTSDDPQDLARAATRAEMRQPGTLERGFGGMGPAGMAGNMLTMVAGAFIGTAIATAVFSDLQAQAEPTGGEVDPGAGDAGWDGGIGSGGDFGGGDFGGGDFGGSDFGGSGDFGGGDFGGGF
jgi:hypothetical protein